MHRIIDNGLDGCGGVVIICYVPYVCHNHCLGSSKLLYKVVIAITDTREIQKEFEQSSYFHGWGGVGINFNPIGAFTTKH